MATWFPVVSVMGPRQSGKSTLLRHAFPDYAYLNLETRNLRTAAQTDPVGFVNERPARLFIDEAQYAPDLFPEIQAAADERHEMGQYLISGSQNFLLLKRVDESLAGRVGILQLLPLSYGEAIKAKPELTPDGFMFKGGYPHLYEVDVPESTYFRSYVTTYIQRDVAEVLDVRNVQSFRVFLRLCAQSAGQLVNISKLAAEANISSKTAKEWLSILTSSYIIFTLAPYASNVRKRLTKTPKLYFHDTGLLTYLLGITSAEQLASHDKRGEVFENLIIEETLKRHLNRDEEPELCFYRDTNGVEVDLVDLTDIERPQLIEIKSGQTARDDFCKHLVSVGEELGVPPERRSVVYRGSVDFSNKVASFVSAKTYLLQ
ncbi:ATP-binding protein [Bifidobacterium amazonense]|uniref:ATP-binding protein n=1 Tax=Bifidobacterium amazonense TaxID=2809027 RepID=A0ABS9VTE3_9BIFI|nr:ATP-binding protein [Bifidobacterium amazonense]MCH9275357.1 ATP-binding protein [Bifidobacterium amazonense]